MAGVIEKFFLASILMWMVPITILYCFNHNLVPGIAEMSSYSSTLLSGFIAVIAVNVIIALYIYMAMKEPSDKHQPDNAFLAEAKGSMRLPRPNAAENAAQTCKKEE